MEATNRNIAQSLIALVPLVPTGCSYCLFRFAASFRASAS